MQRLAQRLAMRSRLLSGLCLLAGLLSGLAARPALAQNEGFQLNRYEPTAAGEWSFAVDHPWFNEKSGRSYAAGLTLNYAHKPFVLGLLKGDSFSEQRDIISHQLITHLDVAASFLDRVLVTASLPVVWVTRSDSVDQGVAVGDPRIGVVGRGLGQPYHDKISMSFGLQLWLPMRGMIAGVPDTVSDQSVRFLPRLMLGGVWQKLLWSATVGLLIRPDARAIVSLPGMTTSVAGRAGTELQFGLAASYFNQDKRFAVGPELLIATTAVGRDAFSRFGTSLELLLAGHYRLLDMLQTGLALGFGFVRQPGTPDFRLLARVAYAPGNKRPLDSDGDGIPDSEDACPKERGVRTSDRATNGCPPLADRDADGVPDKADVCPDTPQGSAPDLARPGCPLPPPDADRDRDGVPDRSDLCPDNHQSQIPDPTKRGCPAVDTDRDGYFDHEDACPSDSAGMNPDPTRKGCPLLDRDRDTVPDVKDACPDQAGAPHPDPKKNGCPSLVEVKDGKLIILKPVYFALDKDIILPESFPVLQAVANALKATPAIQKLRVEGHTDNQGNPAYNMELSNRRARSVMRWLTQKGGVAPQRLDAQGYGLTRPIDSNATPEGQARNRRVEFTILAQTGG